MHQSPITVTVRFAVSPLSVSYSTYRRSIAISRSEMELYPEDMRRVEWVGRPISETRPYA